MLKFRFNRELDSVALTGKQFLNDCEFRFKYQDVTHGFGKSEFFVIG